MGVHGKDCCEETDDFDLCLGCRAGGTKCACADDEHKAMLTLQKSVSGDVLISEKGDATRRLASVSEMRCTTETCQRLVTRGRYYCASYSPPFAHPSDDSREVFPGCPECDDTLCEDCYRQGQTCHLPEEHRLYVYLRANVDRLHPDLATDGIDCKACKRSVKQGPFYRK